MPECRKCGASFPNHVEIQGKKRNLCKRKYCLKCSPFGEHNTIKIEESYSDKKRFCNTCKKYYTYSRKGSHNKNLCVSCQTKKRREKIRKYVRESLGGKCALCGYSKYSGALEAHHINPKNKKFRVADAASKSKSAIDLELEGCVLLCSNCHKGFYVSRVKSKKTMYVNSIRRKNKKFAVEYKGGECVLCGFKDDLKALDFHHVDSKSKEYKVSDLFSCKTEKIINELDKCVLLCSNCHKELHAGVVTL